jgi:hypothetical protein
MGVGPVVPICVAMYQCTSFSVRGIFGILSLVVGWEQGADLDPRWEAADLGSRVLAPSAS